MDGGAAAGGVRLIHTRPSAHPPRKGPFAALSKIVRHRVELSEDEDWIDRRLDGAFPSVLLPEDHPFARYEGIEHNDATVLGCEFERDAVVLTIDHYNVERLAAVILRDGAWRRQGLRWFHGRFPVTFRFEKVNEVYAVVDAEIGLYRILRASRRSLSTNLNDVIALRHIGKDCFRLEMNTRRGIRITKGYGILPSMNLFLQCREVCVRENLRQNWIDAVGEETLPLMEKLLSLGPVQSWCVPDFERFVAEHR